MVKLKTDQVGRAGEAFVTAEILRRGGYAVMFSGNMPGIDILASDVEHTHTVTVQVKTKTTGDWQTDIRRGRTWDDDPEDRRFWILVDLSHEHPEFFVMPAYWIENDIVQRHAEYLEAHGGHRARSAESTHHSINVKRLEQWRGRWDVLGIFV